MLMKRGIGKAVEDIVARLKTMKIDVKTSWTWKTSLRWPRTTTVKFAVSSPEAMEKVGKDGVITVEEGKTLETSHEFVEGMQLIAVTCRPYFVTDPQRWKWSSQDPYFLIHEKRFPATRTSFPCW